MTQEEILEGNKLIAEFMGAEKVDKHPQSKSTVVTFKLGKTTIVSSLGNFKFHSSWDWLMPIVEKIQHMDNKFEVNIDFQIHLMGAVELHINHKRVFGMTAFEPGTLINAVYEGVVEFIKWYNKQKT